MDFFEDDLAPLALNACNMIASNNIPSELPSCIDNDELSLPNNTAIVKIFNEYMITTEEDDDSLPSDDEHMSIDSTDDSSGNVEWDHLIDVDQHFQEQETSSAKKRMRVTLNDEQKSICINIYKNVRETLKNSPSLRSNNKGISEAVKQINKQFTSYKISRRTLKRIINARNQIKKRGKKIIVDFELEVLQRCIFVTFDNNGRKVQIIGNILFTSNILLNQARKVQMSERWINNTVVQALKLSHHWAECFFNRHCMSRRVISHASPTSPNFDEIYQYLSDIQNFMKQNNINNDSIYNTDQTAIYYDSPPTHIYTFKKCERRHITGVEEKKRVTIQSTVDANGKLLPPFFIIKNYVSDMDHSTSRVLESLQERMKSKNEWEIITKTFSTNIKRKYMINKINNSIVTANSSAWCDTLTFQIYIEHLLKHFGKNKSVLLLDNYSVHESTCVTESLNKINIIPKYIPANATGLLQPLDLGFHKQLKSHLQQRRTNEIVKYGRTWMRKCARSIAMDRVPAPFLPPKPDIANVIEDLVNYYSNNEKHDSIKSSFYKAGVIPNENGFYNQDIQVHDSTSEELYYHLSYGIKFERIKQVVEEIDKQNILV